MTELTPENFPWRPEEIYALVKERGKPVKELLLEVFMPPEDAPDELVEERLQLVEQHIRYMNSLGTTN